MRLRELELERQRLDLELSRAQQKISLSEKSVASIEATYKVSFLGF